MPKLAEQDRQTRILDAAENAIAELGFAGASLRHIVLEAQVNLATVYYYFGSKRGLMEAVLKRHFGPLRQEHLALLSEFEAAAGGRPLPVGKILEAMLLPPLRLAAKAPAKRQAVTRLIGRIVTEPNPQIQHVLSSQRMEVRTAFLRALRPISLRARSRPPGSARGESGFALPSGARAAGESGLGARPRSRARGRRGAQRGSVFSLSVFASLSSSVVSRTSSTARSFGRL